MNHPWEEIRLADYEQHMQLDSVGQLQALNVLMKEQLGSFPVRTAMILGIASGNGLEHIRKDQYDTVWGIDINEAYLLAAEERYPELRGILRCLCLDLSEEPEKLPQAELVIADLLVEYIGYDAFQRVIPLFLVRLGIANLLGLSLLEGHWINDGGVMIRNDIPLVPIF